MFPCPFRTVNYHFHQLVTIHNNILLKGKKSYCLTVLLFNCLIA